MADWDTRFIEMAALVASWSKDPSTQCGAVIVRPDRSVASVGFNGFAKGCSDAPEFYENRELKYERVVHAEVNAILLAREPLAGYTIYTYPPGWGPSCARCSSHIIQSGITRVVHYQDTSEFAARWKDSAEIGLAMYAEAGVEVVHLAA
jgi:dCMP deaminase